MDFQELGEHVYITKRNECRYFAAFTTALICFILANFNEESKLIWTIS